MYYTEIQNRIIELYDFDFRVLKYSTQFYSDDLKKIHKQFQDWNGGGTHRLFNTLTKKVGTIPTLSTFLEKGLLITLKNLKKNELMSTMLLSYKDELDKWILLRLFKAYRSHIIELSIIGYFKEFYKNIKIISSTNIDMILGVDFILEDSKTQKRYYVHVTQEGTNYKNKESRGRMKRDFTGHVGFYYCIKNDLLNSHFISLPTPEKIEHYLELWRNSEHLGESLETIYSELDRLNDYMKLNKSNIKLSS